MSEAKEEQLESGKEAKEFENYRKKLVAVLGGDSLLKARSKLPKDDFLGAIQELTTERKAAKVAEVKTDIIGLIDDYVAYERFKKEKQKEMEVANTAKQKAFNQRAKSIFDKIDGIRQIEEEYATALQGAAAPVAEPPTGEATSL